MTKQTILLGGIFDDYQLGLPRAQAGLPSGRYDVWEHEDIIWAEFYRLDEGYLFRLNDYADFTIAYDGSSCLCHPVPGLESETRDHFFRNQVQPFLWNRRGKLIFHASCVEIGDAAIAFMGGSGMGKSTLATSFVRGGRRFLTDDGLLIEKSGDAFLAYPSDPSIRLWDQSHKALIAPDTPTAPSVSFTDKLRLMASSNLPHCASPRALSAVFFLANDGGNDIKIEKVTGAARHISWSSYSFNMDVWDTEAMISTFNDVADLSAAIPSYTLDYPRKYNALDEVKSRIEALVNVHMA